MAFAFHYSNLVFSSVQGTPVATDNFHLVALTNCLAFHCIHIPTEAACAVGYYDQAHFINNFKAFAAYSPNEFLALSG